MTGYYGLFECRSRLAAELLENDRQRAEARKGCLEHVQPHETGHEQPVHGVILRENKAPQDNDAGKGQDNTIDTHKPFNSPQFGPSANGP